MLDVGWTELLVIGALALIVVGPRDLPQLLSQVGRWVGQIKRMAREFQRSIEDAARDSDVGNLKELRDLRKDLTSLDFKQQAAKAQSYLKQPVKVEPSAGAKPAQPPAGQGSAGAVTAAPGGGAATPAASSGAGAAVPGSPTDSPSGGSSGSAVGISPDNSMPGVAATPPPATAPREEQRAAGAAPGPASGPASGAKASEG